MTTGLTGPDDLPAGMARTAVELLVVEGSPFMNWARSEIIDDARSPLLCIHEMTHWQQDDVSGFCKPLLSANIQQLYTYVPEEAAQGSEPPTSVHLGPEGEGMGR